jgi:cytochrome c oxidase subunit II
MTNFLIVSALILLLAILFLVFRIQTLVSVLKGSYHQRAGYSNKVNAFLFMVFLVFGLIALYWSYTSSTKDFLPESASEHGVITDKLFWITMGIITIAFVVTHVLLFYFAYRYQYSDKRKAEFFPDNTKLEIIWTIIPAVVMAGLVFSGLKIWTDITSPAPENATLVEIKGKQFGWQVRYAGSDGKIGGYDYRLIDATNTFGMDFSDKSNFDDFVPREIRLPKGKPVQFNIRAVDVLHSVFLPHFRQKMDAVPGMMTTFHFVPKYTTEEMRAITGNPKFNYELACTEICGRGHFAMRMIVVVEEEDAYNKWYKEQKSWLSSNPDYIASVPHSMKNLALEKAGLETETSN